MSSEGCRCELATNMLCFERLLNLCTSYRIGLSYINIGVSNILNIKSSHSLQLPLEVIMISLSGHAESTCNWCISTENMPSEYMGHSADLLGHAVTIKWWMDMKNTVCSGRCSNSDIQSISKSCHKTWVLLRQQLEWVQKWHCCCGVF